MKSLLVKINNKLNAQGGFLKAVSVLVGGTAFAQFLAFLCLPILTRLYSPEDYAVLGIYVAIVSILSVIACLRLEIAIPIPEKDENAKSLLVISLTINIILIAILYLLLLLAYPLIKDFHIIQQLSIWIWFVPLGVFLSGLYSALQYWSTRKKRFKDIAQTRMTQALLGNGTSLGLGVFAGGFGGLILGQLFSFGGGVLKLGSSTYKDIKQITKKVAIRHTLLEYQNFPKYSTLEALANTSAIQLPLIIIASLMIGPEVGYLMLAMKIMTLPMSLLGSTISQVYYAQAAEKKQQGLLKEYTTEIIIQLQRISCLIPIGSLILYFLIPFILGDKWHRTGEIILWMAPWFVFQFVASPISMVMHLQGRQKQMLLLTASGLLLRISAIFSVVSYLGSYLAEAFAISSAIFYIICYLVFCKSIDINLASQFYILRKNKFFIISLLVTFSLIVLLWM
ncbi:lipopolysaccharide biosynthesis protein [Acinetobacter baumannii]|uniref:lipopolysaccharide biosynthesis protein n=1 Tax=Acinetobacter baumannii TaxID=470 RepID=UPI00259F1CD5|nr:oligosaccharide flippase family protein [Acinetobacter baumannii]